MSLPPGFLDELRTRLSLAQVAGRKVMWDMRKSNQGKGDWWAPCPFHQEKSASFHVDDRKGFYYCFGCHAKGDMISFVRETENVGFMEAVRILAQEAGLALPERDPQSQQKADRRTQLADVTEAALRYFRMMLRAGSGEAARAYLTRRALSDAAVDRWEIGYAPDAWQGLWDHLRGTGVAEDLIFDAGLAKPSTKGGKPYDVFRGRVIFPIRDARGRCIGFGGRTLKDDNGPKYLNSPATDLFDKSRALYNHGPAREAAGKDQPLIVAEGYMDVIALSEAGFTGAVAPLGTAITEDHLRMLWRITPEPIVMLDGDRAGIQAAFRTMDLALPLLEAGQSLRFALMPEGQDPDDLLRSKGAKAVSQVLDAAEPMVNLLWRRETEGKVLDSPERRAALDKALRTAIGRIADPSIRGHYGQAIKDFRWQLFRSRPKAKAPAARSETAATALAQGLIDEESLRESVILAVLLRNPSLVDSFAGALEEMQCLDPSHERLRAAILADPGGDAEGDLATRVADRVGSDALDAVLSHPHVAIVPAVRRPEPELAHQSLQAEIEMLRARRGHAQELSELLEEFTDYGDDHMMRRLGLTIRAMQNAQKGESENRTEYEIGPNGAHMRREERGALDALLARITYDKGRR